MEWENERGQKRGGGERRGEERGLEGDYKFMRFPVKKNTIVVPTV